MKRICYIIPFILSVLVCSPNAVLSQSGWLQYSTGAPFASNTISVADANTLYITAKTSAPSAFYFIKSTNGGLNWANLVGGIISRSPYLTFLNANTGWIFAADGYIGRTTNAGENWVSQGTQGVYIFYYNYGYFINSQTGWALGNSIDTGNHHYIIKTTNGGDNWSVVYDDVNVASHNRIQFINPNTGWCISGTKFLKSTNGGLNWVRYFPASYGYQSISFTDDMTGWLSDTNGVLQKTTNGGLNWVMLVNSNFKRINEIAFLNSNTGYAAGSQRILKTTDGGAIWILQYKDNAAALSSIKFVNDNTGYACCKGTNILKTTNGGNWLVGINTISSVPAEFSLEQNYPNPFNPVTNIKFAVPVTGNMKISVYNILGDEIEILVNENLTPGTYSVDFNAEKYSSGVYFYRLQSEKFSDSKKMIIAK